MADFGLAEDMYGTKYYRRSKSESEERVPIRWMAPESIETNIYNEATDVVSLLYSECCILGHWQYCRKDRESAIIGGMNTLGYNGKFGPITCACWRFHYN